MMISDARVSDRISPAALSHLLDCRRQFLAFIEKRVESREKAEDILQSAFVKGIEKGGILRNDETVVSWFYRLLRNAIIDHYRHRDVSERGQKRILQELETQTEPSDLLKSSVCECILSLARTLKPEYQQAIETVDLLERPLADLGTQAGISLNNAAVRVHRARAALRKQVRIACGVCATHGCMECDCN